MGELCILVNYTRKEFHDPGLKFSELIKNPQEKFFNLLQNEWNACVIGILFSLQPEYSDVIKEFTEVWLIKWLKIST